jgi:two-component system chemotaxis sensor kinase CheA
MDNHNEEFKKIFYSEAQEQYEQLNKHFTILEKDSSQHSAIEAVFRITHTLKANAASMGYTGISEMAHILEDIFSLIKDGKITLNTDLFNTLFRANDKIGDLITSVKTEEKISYKGLLTKLKVLLRKETATHKTTAPEKKPVKELVQNDNQELQEEEKEVDNTQKDVVEKEETTPKITFSDVVQVPVEKLDGLLNLVGELSIEKDKIIADGNKQLGEASTYASLNRISSDLQYNVMGARLVKVDILFQKFHRIVRDISLQEGKKINLEFKGTTIEIDRNVLQTITESMIHLVRNAISHGIEQTETRRVNGKNEAGNIKLIAKNEKNNIVIQVIDDGKGMDIERLKSKIIQKGLASATMVAQMTEDEVIKHIFHAGFSSLDKVTNISGRGVGMDVVKKAVELVGGEIRVKTKKGEGTTFSMHLPSSMAVKKALLFELKGATFALPVVFTEAVISQKKSKIRKAVNGLLSTYLDQTISVIFLNDLFDIEDISKLKEQSLLQGTFDELPPDTLLNIIITSIDNQLVGLVVDKLLQQKEIIEKNLERPLNNIPFISGATIFGSGDICLIIDVPSIIDFMFNPLTNIQMT